MANPQPDQYTKVSNELLEAFCCLHLSGSEWSVVHAIIRKTYGFNKKEDWVTNTQIALMTGLGATRVSEAKTKLLEAGVITQKRKKVALQKDYEKWNKLRKTVIEITENRKKSYGKPYTQKKKETITKESTQIMKKETYIDYETGETKEVTKPKKTSNKETISLVHLFEKRGEEVTGVKPDLTKAYFKIQQAMKIHNLSPDDVKSLFTHFFNNRKLTNEQKIGLSLCISGSYISQWKVSEKNRPVSQAAAASEIIL